MEEGQADTDEKSRDQVKLLQSRNASTAAKIASTDEGPHQNIQDWDTHGNTKIPLDKDNAGEMDEAKRHSLYLSSMAPVLTEFMDQNERT